METLVHRLPTPCYFLSPNCVRSVLVRVDVDVCFLIYLPGEQRENSYVTEAGALWLAVLREAPALIPPSL